MEHLQIAYELIVIIIGAAALSIAISWALRTGEAYLRNFCLVYALFTSVLILTVLKKYLFLNVEGYSAWSWYVISGILQIFTWAVVVAMIHFLLGVYHVKAGRLLTFAFLLLMIVCTGISILSLGRGARCGPEKHSSWDRVSDLVSWLLCLVHVCHCPGLCPAAPCLENRQAGHRAWQLDLRYGRLR